MATLKGPLKLEGRVGDLIFYRRGNKTCCRSAPSFTPEKMTAATKESAREFGQASKAGKLMRDALNGLWPVPADSGMVNRLSKALYSALRQDTAHPRGERVITAPALQEALKDFYFNDRASLRFQVKTKRQPGGAIRVNLQRDWPALIRTPRFASHVQVQVAALTIDFAAGECHKAATATDYIVVNAPHNGNLPALQLRSPAGVATVIIMQVRFIKEEENGRLYSSGDQSCAISCVVDVLAPEKTPEAAVPLKKTSRPATPKAPPAILKRKTTPQQPGQQDQVLPQAPS